jgi:hypothetical protein
MKQLLQFSLTGLLLASLAGLWWERNRLAESRTDNQRLREELGEAQRLANSKEVAQNAQQSEELERLRAEAREVHKLRNEVSQLRAGAKQVEQLRTENQQLRAASRAPVPTPTAGAAAPPATAPQEAYYAKENWTFTGYATPDAALQSAIWAMREGDTRTFFASLAPEEMARLQKEWGNKSEAQVAADTKRQTDRISSIRILESKALSDDEVVLSIYATGGEDHVQKISMKRFGTEWKMAGPKRD